jgi:hypothetical protein
VHLPAGNVGAGEEGEHEQDDAGHAVAPGLPSSRATRGPHQANGAPRLLLPLATGAGRGHGEAHALGFRVSGFQGFRVSGFLGFRCRPLPDEGPASRSPRAFSGILDHLVEAPTCAEIPVSHCPCWGRRFSLTYNACRRVK